jgi:hypothetical protein
MTLRPHAITLAAIVTLAAFAGCLAKNDSANLTGTNTAGTKLELVSANVVDGSLRDITVKNRGDADIPAGAWLIHMTGTSGRKAATHDANVQGLAIPKGQTIKVSLKGDQQPDWQDGTDLTIDAKAPNGYDGRVTIKTV